MCLLIAALSKEFLLIAALSRSFFFAIDGEEHNRGGRRQSPPSYIYIYIYVYIYIYIYYNNNDNNNNNNDNMFEGGIGRRRRHSKTPSASKDMIRRRN